ncbi:hypothetical protein GLOIN_2v1778313 [Rhizophagus irregularis DAOM 181602=DAOM 197198]|nr:hypothetical protein GLOIN_2v1778313 [Rhizophagus irregularis DAOM 181602=DAOM 197198]
MLLHFLISRRLDSSAILTRGNKFFGLPILFGNGRRLVALKSLDAQNFEFHFWLGCMDFGKIQKISFFRRRVWTSEFGDFSCRILDTDCSSAVYRRPALQVSLDLFERLKFFFNSIGDYIKKRRRMGHRTIVILRRLIGVSKSNFDKILCISFLTIRTLLQIVHIALFRLHVGNICKFEDRAKIVRWGYIGIDLIIDIFVTIRLIQVLKKRIQNAAESNQMTERSPKNNMFNAVNYWSYLQLGSTLTFNILAVVEIITWLKYGSVLTIRIFQTLNNIIFSYMITYDKEIVKTIAGKAARAKYFNSLVKNLHKNSVTIENIKLEDFDNNSNKRNMVSLSIDNEEFTVV